MVAMSDRGRARRALAHAALLLAALLFGGTFVVVKDAVRVLPPHAFVAWRFLLGSAALLGLGLLPGLPGGGLPRSRRLWRDGLVAGSLLFGGYALQTVGLTSTSASHSALITGLYVVLTPLLAAAVARRRPSGPATLGTTVAFAGLALLAWPADLRFGGGDLLTVGCAVLFAGHVVALAHSSSSHPTVPFTAVQLLVVAALAFAFSAALEGLPRPDERSVVPLVLTGLGATAGAFLLQVWSQAVVGPARAVVLLSLETVFGAIFGAWILAERLEPRGWIGAALILAGIQVVLFLTRADEDLPAAEATTPAH
jgi:drug/metabolite transporter (DMT)-like permease